MTNKQLFKKEYIPNYLTILRIILLPIIVVLLLVPSQQIIYQWTNWSNSIVSININNFVAGIIFIVASITDFLDGFLARKFNWISNFGKFWDPLADKILTNAVLFCFASVNQDLIPMWIPIIFLVRDIIVDGLRLIVAKKQIVIPANWWGKSKTFIMMIAMIFILFCGSSLSNVGIIYYYAIQLMCLYIALLLSLVSGFIYLWDGYKIIHNINNDKN